MYVHWRWLCGRLAVLLQNRVTSELVSFKRDCVGVDLRQKIVSMWSRRDEIALTGLSRQHRLGSWLADGCVYPSLATVTNTPTRSGLNYARLNYARIHVGWTAAKIPAPERNLWDALTEGERRKPLRYFVMQMWQPAEHIRRTAHAPASQSTSPTSHEAPKHVYCRRTWINRYAEPCCNWA